MTEQTIKVKASTVHKRIIRMLARQNQSLRKNPHPDGPIRGEWLVVQKYTAKDTSKIVHAYANLTAAARDLGVLEGYEVIADE